MPHSASSTESAPSISSAPFGVLPDGSAATLYTLVSRSGSRLRVTDYGGIVVSIEVPDRSGRLGDVVLGFDSVEGYTSEAYLRATPYIGALIGRYANRITDGRFTLDGVSYQLATNDGENHLHGGERGFDRRVWAAEPFEHGGDVGLRLSRTSPDGEEGYPGTLQVTVTYTFSADDRLVIDYEATTDAPTVINLTHHAYFNLTGDPAETVLDHVLAVRADAFTPVRAGGIPTGEIRPVAGTPFDFRQPAAIGACIDADDGQLALTGGYDHNFVLTNGGALAEAVRVVEPKTGRVLTLRTTEPGVQVYTGNYLDGSLTGKGNVAYERRTGFCLETQHYPDSPNQSAFPSTVLRPEGTYRSQTVYAFGTDAADL